MRIEIGDTTIQLPDKEVRSCRKVLANFMKTVRSESEQKGYYTYYFTLLFVMWMVSHQIITRMDPKLFADVMESLGGKKRGPLSFPDEQKAFDDALTELEKIRQEGNTEETE